MCNAITLPTQREVKMIEGLYGKGKFREVWVCGFSKGGSENLISAKTRTINYETFSFAKEFGVGNKVID